MRDVHGLRLKRPVGFVPIDFDKMYSPPSTNVGRKATNFLDNTVYLSLLINKICTRRRSLQIMIMIRSRKLNLYLVYFIPALLSALTKMHANFMNDSISILRDFPIQLTLAPVFRFPAAN